MNRKTFLLASAGIGAASLKALLPVRLKASGHSLDPHPEPRPDIDGSNVLSQEFMQGFPDIAPIYDGIREIPHIADGVACRCGCHGQGEYRSLLSCFESGGMALGCEICQTEGRVVARLHGRGRTLDQIRAAIDARFGTG